MSHIRCLGCHMSGVTCHMQQVNFFNKMVKLVSGVCYQLRGLPRQISTDSALSKSNSCNVRFCICLYVPSPCHFALSPFHHVRLSVRLSVCSRHRVEFFVRGLGVSVLVVIVFMLFVCMLQTCLCAFRNLQNIYFVFSHNSIYHIYHISHITYHIYHIYHMFSKLFHPVHLSSYLIFVKSCPTVSLSKIRGGGQG